VTLTASIRDYALAAAFGNVWIRPLLNLEKVGIPRTIAAKVAHGSQSRGV
jgi:hypothetical protein